MISIFNFITISYCYIHTQYNGKLLFRHLCLSFYNFDVLCCSSWVNITVFHLVLYVQLCVILVRNVFKIKFTLASFGFWQFTLFVCNFNQYWYRWQTALWPLINLCINLINLYMGNSIYEINSVLKPYIFLICTHICGLPTYIATFRYLICDLKT